MDVISLKTTNKTFIILLIDKYFFLLVPTDNPDAEISAFLKYMQGLADCKEKQLKQLDIKLPPDLNSLALELTDDTGALVILDPNLKPHFSLALIPPQLMQIYFLSIESYLP